MGASRASLPRVYLARLAAPRKISRCGRVPKTDRTPAPAGAAARLHASRRLGLPLVCPTPCARPLRAPTQERCNITTTGRVDRGGFL